MELKGKYKINWEWGDYAKLILNGIEREIRVKLLHKCHNVVNPQWN